MSNEKYGLPDTLFGVPVVVEKGHKPSTRRGPSFGKFADLLDGVTMGAKGICAACNGEYFGLVTYGKNSVPVKAVIEHNCPCGKNELPPESVGIAE